MDLLTRTDLKGLAAPAGAGPAVSLMMPTERVVTDADADPLRWKNLVSGVASLLVDEGKARRDVDELLAPAWELHADTSAWQHMSDGLAMFIGPDRHRRFRVPVGLPQVATVGDRFVVSPLLGAVSGEEHFLVLALSQREVRLLDGTRHRIEEVDLGEVPTDLRDVVEPPEPRSDTIVRPAGRGGMGGAAVFYGHGAADDSFKKEEVTKFLRRVADGLHPYLADQDHPVVLVGLDHLVGTYREVNDYHGVLERSVDHNPDGLSAEELHELAWPVVAERYEQTRTPALERFRELNGTGRASTDPDAIEIAAAEGRVEALFLPDVPSCWEEAASSDDRTVRLGADTRFAACEQLDRAVVATLTTDGTIYSLPEQSVLEGAMMAATFRY